MAGRCGECRFFNGGECNILGVKRSTSGTCFRFASYTKSNSRTCKDCRFFNGKECNVLNVKRSTSGTCSKFSPFR